MEILEISSFSLVPYATIARWQPGKHNHQGGIMPRTLLLLALAIDLFLHAPSAIQAEEATPVRLDRFGDPLTSGVLVRLGTVRFHRCGCAAYSLDGKIIVTGDGDGTYLWEAATGKKIRELPATDRGPAGLIFSHDGKKLAAVGWGGTVVEVWDLRTFEKVVLPQVEGGSGGGDWSNAAAFSSDDKTVVSGTSTDLFVWELASGKKLKQFPWRVKDKPLPIRLIAFSEDGKVAATQGDKELHLWDAQTGKLLHEIKLLSDGETMKFSRDGKTLAVPGWRRWVPLFNVETGKKIHSLPASEQVWSVAFSPDGKTLATASNGTIGSSSTEAGQAIQLWDLTNLKAAPVTYNAPGIHSVTFSPDGKTLAWRCHATLCFMERITGKDQRPTPSHRGAIKSLVYLPDGKRVVSASEDGAVRIWDAATGASLNVLHGHNGEVTGLAIYPNGSLLASCGRDGTPSSLGHGARQAPLRLER
jgi:WD40 repeat protein